MYRMNRGEANRVSIDASYYGVDTPFEKIHVPNATHHTRETIRKKQGSEMLYFLRGQHRLEDFIDWHNLSKVPRLSFLIERARNGYDGIEPDTFSCLGRVLRRYI